MREALVADVVVESRLVVSQEHLLDHAVSALNEHPHLRHRIIDALTGGMRCELRVCFPPTVRLTTLDLICLVRSVIMGPEHQGATHRRVGNCARAGLFGSLSEVAT